MLTLTIIGNGGCLNAGLPYNAFLLNDHILVEAPPDIMLSLNTLHLALQPIDTIFISHLHGDHTFGLPFLMINKWLASQQQQTTPITIFGPQGIAHYTQHLVEYAFTPAHPCYAWMLQNVTFSTVTNQSEITWDTLSVRCFGLQHLVETYGFLLTQQQNSLFAYIADTSWCPAVDRILAHNPRTVLMDMNGLNQVHIAITDVLAKGLPLTGTQTEYYGTHLAAEFVSPHPAIICAKPGARIELEIESHTDK
jgi:phosphoribosyl 1,2-cyclic phosphodiesterase